MDVAALLTPEALAVLGQVILIDLVLAGDNAIVVGSIAASLPRDRQRTVILAGIGVALVLRIAFALVATQLLKVPGLQFVGGVMLGWVAWKMWSDLRGGGHVEDGVGVEPRTMRGAIWAVALADVSMSLDNVVGVAAASRDHPAILVIGLVFSVLLMGAAANLVARVIDRYRWIAYAGLAVIVWVAVRMVYDGIVAPEIGIRALLA